MPRLPRRLLAVALAAAIAALVLAAPAVATGPIAQQTAWTGAPSWWAAGFIGGTGSSDTTPTNVVIASSDEIQADHPAFAGATFERPAGAPSGGPPFSSATLHGTEVAGAGVLRGATGCGLCVPDDANEKGIAPGVSTVLDDFGAFRANAWWLGFSAFSSDPSDAQSGATHTAQIVNVSAGSSPSVDDSAVNQNIDKYITTYGLTIAYPSGNDGPGASSVDEPCSAYDTLCVGGAAINGTFAHTSDVVAGFSSRGPTIAGRKKPDLVALAAAGGGASNIGTTRDTWQGDANLWRADNGTSFASPQVAGAAALMHGAGITGSLAEKALMIDSARMADGSAGHPAGTQTTWDPAWGWGELDLTSALTERANVRQGSVSGSADASAGVQFYSATTSTTGDRATLVWNRRVGGCLNFNILNAPAGVLCTGNPSDTTARALSNLDLVELDAATGATRASSTSTIDNVEQVRSPNGAAVIYKVKNQSGSIDGASSEPFALAALNAPTSLASPQPTVTAGLSASEVHQGDVVTVTSTITNPSPDLTGQGGQVTLALPAGVQLAGGSNPVTQSVGTLARNGQAGDHVTVTWAVQGTSDGIRQLAVTGQATRYGETFTRTAAAALLVDSTPPSVTIAGPTGTQSDPRIPLTWSATDAGAGVASYDVAIQIDGGAFAPLLNATGATSTTYTGTAGHSYAFAVRARDALGNTSGYVTAGPVTIVSPPPGGCQATHSCPPPKASAALALRAITWRGRTLRLAGRTARDLSGTLRFSVRCRRSTLRSTTRVRRGTWSKRWRLSARCDRTTLTTLTLTYPGDSRHRSQTLHRSVRRSR